jgi:hypothetical protein
MVTGGERVAFDVDVSRLDDVSQELQFTHLDLVKIDIEGAEMKALLGMRAVLHRWLPVLAIEVHPTLLPLYGDTVEALETLFADLNYAWVRIEPEGPPEGNFHLVAGPKEALQRARLLPSGRGSVRLSLRGCHEWYRGPRSQVKVQRGPDLLELEFQLADGDKEYVLTGDHEITSPPELSQEYGLQGDRYTELRWRVAMSGSAACSLWLFEYGTAGFAKTTSFPVTVGAGRVTHATGFPTRTYRVGLRVVGMGSIRFDLLELIQWEAP